MINICFHRSKRTIAHRANQTHEIPRYKVHNFFHLPKMSTGVHTLFGVKGWGTGMSFLLVTARKLESDSSEDVQKAAALAGEPGEAATPVTIAEKPFWRTEVVRKNSTGRVATVTYTTAIEGYVVKFMFGSFDRDFIRQCEQSIQSLSFFVPAEAREIAGPDSRPVLAEHP